MATPTMPSRAALSFWLDAGWWYANLVVRGAWHTWVLRDDEYYDGDRERAMLLLPHNIEAMRRGEQDMKKSRVTTYTFNEFCRRFFA